MFASDVFSGNRSGLFAGTSRLAANDPALPLHCPPFHSWQQESPSTGAFFRVCGGQRACNARWGGWNRGGQAPSFGFNTGFLDGWVVLICPVWATNIAPILPPLPPSFL